MNDDFSDTPSADISSDVSADSTPEIETPVDIPPDIEPESEPSVDIPSDVELEPSVEIPSDSEPETEGISTDGSSDIQPEMEPSIDLPPDETQLLELPADNMLDFGSESEPSVEALPDTELTSPDDLSPDIERISEPSVEIPSELEPQILAETPLEADLEPPAELPSEQDWQAQNDNQSESSELPLSEGTHVVPLGQNDATPSVETVETIAQPAENSDTANVLQYTQDASSDSDNSPNENNQPPIDGEIDWVDDENSQEMPVTEQEIADELPATERIGLSEEGKPDQIASPMPEATGAPNAQNTSTGEESAATVEDASGETADSGKLKTDYAEVDLGKAAREINNENMDINGTDAVLQKQMEQTEQNRAEFRDEAAQYGLTPEQYLEYLGQRNLDPEGMPELQSIRLPEQDTTEAGNETIKGTVLDSKIPSEMPADMTAFKDSQERDITIKRWGDESLIQLRAYDTVSGDVPETPNLGTAGMANLHIETAEDGSKQVKLQDIVVPPDYRNSSIAGNMLDQTVEIAKAKGASEIYGVIENEEALGYWKHMEEKGTGWKVDVGQGAHGYVRYDLSAQANQNMASNIDLGVKANRDNTNTIVDAPTAAAGGGVGGSGTAKNNPLDSIKSAGRKRIEETQRQTQADLQKNLANTPEYDSNGKTGLRGKIIEQVAGQAQDQPTDAPISSTELLIRDRLSRLAGTKWPDAVNPNDVISAALVNTKQDYVAEDMQSKSKLNALYNKITGNIGEVVSAQSSGRVDANKLIESNMAYLDQLGIGPDGQSQIVQSKAYVTGTEQNIINNYITAIEKSQGDKKNLQKAATNIYNQLQNPEKSSALEMLLPKNTKYAQNPDEIAAALRDNVIFTVPDDHVEVLQKALLDRGIDFSPARIIPMGLKSPEIRRLAAIATIAKVNEVLTNNSRNG